MALSAPLFDVRCDRHDRSSCYFAAVETTIIGLGWRSDVDGSLFVAVLPILLGFGFFVPEGLCVLLILRSTPVQDTEDRQRRVRSRLCSVQSW